MQRTRECFLVFLLEGVRAALRSNHDSSVRKLKGWQVLHWTLQGLLLFVESEWGKGECEGVPIRHHEGWDPIGRERGYSGILTSGPGRRGRRDVEVGCREGEKVERSHHSY